MPLYLRKDVDDDYDEWIKKISLYQQLLIVKKASQLKSTNEVTVKNYIDVAFSTYFRDIHPNENINEYMIKVKGDFKLSLLQHEDRQLVQYGTKLYYRFKNSFAHFLLSGSFKYGADEQYRIGLKNFVNIQQDSLIPIIKGGQDYYVSEILALRAAIQKPIKDRFFYKKNIDSKARLAVPSIHYFINNAEYDALVEKLATQDLKEFSQEEFASQERALVCD